jgi:hypothetical protein
VAVVDQQVSAGQNLQARDPGEANAREFLLNDASDDFAIRSHIQN